MKELISVAHFLKSVFLHWLTLILFLPTVYDLSHAYLMEPFASYELGVKERLAFLIACIFTAVYRAWRAEYFEKQELMQKKVSFEITPKFYKLSDYKHRSKISNEIETLKKELPQLSSEDWFSRLDFNRPKSIDTVSDYINDLENYKKEIHSFVKLASNVVAFELEINSSGYDENISISSQISKGEFIDNFDLLLPAKPSPAYERFNFSLPLVTNNHNQPVYRSNINSSPNCVSCDIANIKKGQTAFFFNDFLFFKHNPDEGQIEIQITSKNSNGSKKFQVVIPSKEKMETLDLSEIIT